MAIKTHLVKELIKQIEDLEKQIDKVNLEALKSVPKSEIKDLIKSFEALKLSQNYDIDINLKLKMKFKVDLGRGIDYPFINMKSFKLIADHGEYFADNQNWDESISKCLLDNIGLSSKLNDFKTKIKHFEEKYNFDLYWDKKEIIKILPELKPIFEICF